MKSNTYVFIDAHIIRCRLHHNNNLKYSVALKSGKEQQVATQYQPSKDLTIQMDSHLALHADKHSYDNFPKLTLIVNVMTENGERKTVGTTFANFRKEGVQIFQVSECSCKDKAFQVQISFVLKIAEPKDSKSTNNKNQLNQDKKTNYFSQQPTPRQSRQIKQDRFAKQVKGHPKIDSQEKLEKMSKIYSEKVLVTEKQRKKDAKEGEKFMQQLRQQVQQLKLKIQQLKHLQKQVQRLTRNNGFLEELLQLQESKNNQAIRYIINLQHSVFGFTPKENLKSTVACVTSFKVIEERDEIVQWNKQLESDLQAQKQKNLLLELQMQQLKQQINRLVSRQRAFIKQDLVQQISVINLNKQVIHSNQILLASICKEKEQSSIIEKERQKLEDLTLQVSNLTKKIENLHIQIDKLQQHKKGLQEISVKKPIQKKMSPIKTQPVKREDVLHKSQKGPSKEKNWKPPKMLKKGIQYTVSIIKSESKKPIEAKASPQIDPKMKIVKMASTEVQSKTQLQQSIQKSSDFLSIEQKSQNNCKTYNEAVYFTDGFQN